MSEVMQFNQAEVTAVVIPDQASMDRTGIFAGAERVIIVDSEFAEINYQVLPSPIPTLPSIQRPSRLFTGRSEYLSRLKDYFSSYTGGQRRCFLLHGHRGIGKTQICLKFVEQHANLFSDIFWIDAYSESNIELRLKQIALAYNVPPYPGTSESILQWISGRSDWLMVYDGADGDFSVIAKFLPPGNGGNILITSRNMGLKNIILDRNYAEVLQMMDEEATSLFSQAAMLDGTPDDTNMAQAIVSYLGGIPILIDKAGEFIQASACTVEDYVDMAPKHLGQLLITCGFIMPSSDLGPSGNIEEMVANLSIEDSA